MMKAFEAYQVAKSLDRSKGNFTEERVRLNFPYIFNILLFNCS